MKKFAEKPRNSATSGAIDKIPVTADLFPHLPENRKRRSWQASPRMTQKATLGLNKAGHDVRRETWRIDVGVAGV